MSVSRDSQLLPGSQLLSDAPLQSSDSPMDTSLPHPQPTQVLPDFTVVPSPSLLRLDSSILQNSNPHITHSLPSVFPNKADHDSLPASMHVALTDVSPSINLSTMDVLDSATSVRTNGTSFTHDFTHSSDAFGIRVLSNDQLPPSAQNSSPNDQPHMPSPNIHSLPSSYSVGTSSLASALCGPTQRSPPDSINGSRSNLLLDTSPSNSTTFGFSPAHFVDDRVELRGSSNDLSHEPHRLDVVEVFRDMKKVGEAAREDCAVGHSDEAGVKIDKLMRLLNLASNLVAAAPALDPTGGLPDGSPNNGYSTVSSSSSTRVSPPLAPPGLVLPFQSDPGVTRVSSTGSMKMDTLDLGNHESRKRCASSVPIGDDRANKAPKREPLEDIIPLGHNTPPSTNHTPPLLQSGNIFQTQQQQHAAAGVVDPRAVTVFPSANALSQPPSRPPSPSKLIEGFNLAQQQQSPQFSGPSKTPPQSDFDSNSSTPTATVSTFPTGSGTRSSWSDGPPSMLPQRQHPHSRSSGSLVDLHGLSMSSFNPATFGAPAVQPSQQPGANPGGASISPPLGRVSRTGSVSNGFVSPFAFGFPDATATAAAAVSAPPLGRPPPPPAATTVEIYDYSKSRPSTATMARRNSDTEDDYYDDDSDDDDGSSPSSRGFQSRPNTSHGGSSGQHGGAESNGSSHHRDDVPQEYREEVDRVFFEFMNKICSNLEATDSKGEPIHQTLMAKKMQRLDESPDFRPFKFRIAAFTHGFLEELAAQGYPEEKIPMKKVRNYLWAQPHISRYNEDGKKSKSKGNHIWIVDAKKTPDGGWVFRPFHRRLTGSPNGVAYIGINWSWTPRVWFPQGPSDNRGHDRPSIPIEYCSPEGSLPSWLSWNGGVLSGTPPAGSDSCDITVDASFTLDGQEERLSQTIHLNIAPVTAVDQSFSHSRRPSLLGEMNNPRRGVSDSVVQQTTPPRPMIRVAQSALGPPTPVASQDQQVMQVLTSAAQRVAEEAQSQVIGAARHEQATPDLQALAKQQHVLTVTAQAFDGVSGQRADGSFPSKNSTVLAAAAQQVVFQAARQVAADRSGTAPAASQVTVNDVSVATQTAVAKAVEITGPLSSEVDVLMTASSLLQQQSRATSTPSQTTLDPSQLVAPDTRRHHSTGSLTRAFPPVPSDAIATSVPVPFPSM